MAQTYFPGKYWNLAQLYCWTRLRRLEAHAAGSDDSSCAHNDRELVEKLKAGALPTRHGAPGNLSLIDPATWLDLPDGLSDADFLESDNARRWFHVRVARDDALRHWPPVASGAQRGPKAGRRSQKDEILEFAEKFFGRTPQAGRYTLIRMAEDLQPIFWRYKVATIAKYLREYGPWRQLPKDRKISPEN